MASVKRDSLTLPNGRTLVQIDATTLNNLGGRISGQDVRCLLQNNGVTTQRGQVQRNDATGSTIGFVDDGRQLKA